MYKKITKNAISILLITTFILSLTPMLTFAESPEYYTDSTSMPWDGTNVPRAKMVSFAGTSVNAEGNSSASDTLKAVMEYNEQGMYGKLEDDASYYTYDYKDRTEDGMVLNSFNSFFYGYAPTMVDGVQEFSFAYDTPGVDNIIIHSLYRLGTNATTGKDYEVKELLTITTNAITFAGESAEYSFEPHKWYTVTVAYDMAGRNYKAFVNGELVIDATYTKTYYGLGQTQFGPALNAEVYWDNLYKYNIENVANFTQTDITKASLQSSTDGIAVKGDVITASDDATVLDIKNAVEASLRENDVLRFYNSDYSVQLEDTDPAKNANVVVASTGNYTDEVTNVERMYTYYTVDRYVYEFAGVNDGSAKPKISGGSNTCILTIESDGIGGKQTGTDKYIKCEDEAGDPYINFNADVLGETISGADIKAYEFSMYLPSTTSSSVGLGLGFWKSDRSEYASYTITFSKNGIKSQSTVKATDFCKMPTDEWVNFALVGPAGNGDNDFELYMNGVEIAKENVVKLGVENFEAGGGFRHARLSGGGSYESGTHLILYLDNLRCITTDSYIPAYDVEASASMTQNYLNFADKTITVPVAGTKVSDILSDLTVPEYTQVRVYNENGEPADDADAVADGYKLVAAATNNTEMERAYSYYTVRVVDGEIAFDTPYIAYNSETSAITANVNVYNYTGSEETYQIYLAIYSDGELVELIPETLISTAGKPTSVNPSCSLGLNEDAKLFVWKEDGITPELKCVETE